VIWTSRAERDEQARCKARVKSRLLNRPELCPRIGRFELIALLGRGGTGLVYAARDTTNGEDVALKLLGSDDPQGVMLFKREFSALVELAHENIVRPSELFADRDTWYFTMELVCGEPFTAYRRRRDWDSRRRALRQLLEAVRFIHSAGRVHCDLKPSNVLVTTEGRVVVLDFGLVEFAFSARAGRRRSTFELRGTPPFIAPELLTGGRHSPESDAYSIGMMLAEAQLAIPGMPQELRAICAGLIEEDPAQRMSLDAACAQLGAAVRVRVPDASPFENVACAHLTL
jgi:serine/threonine protein kinase